MVIIIYFMIVTVYLLLSIVFTIFSLGFPYKTHLLIYPSCCLFIFLFLFFFAIFYFFILLPSFFQFQTLQKSRSKDDECFPIRSVRFLNHIIDSLFTGSSSLSSPVVALPSTLATLSLPHICISISAKRCSTSHCCWFSFTVIAAFSLSKQASLSRRLVISWSSKSCDMSRGDVRLPVRLPVTLLPGRGLSWILGAWPG